MEDMVKECDGKLCYPCHRGSGECRRLLSVAKWNAEVMAEAIDRAVLASLTVAGSGMRV